MNCMEQAMRRPGLPGTLSRLMSLRETEFINEVLFVFSESIPRSHGG